MQGCSILLGCPRGLLKLRSKNTNCVFFLGGGRRWFSPFLVNTHFWFWTINLRHMSHWFLFFFTVYFFHVKESFTCEKSKAKWAFPFGKEVPKSKTFLYKYKKSRNFLVNQGRLEISTILTNFSPILPFLTKNKTVNTFRWFQNRN
jgi:hypothetical protein